MLTQALEVRHRFVAGQHLALNPLVFLRQLGHLLFNGRQIFWRKGTLVGKVVIEAVFNGRTNGDLRLGEQLFHRISQQVRRGVANDVQTVGILVGDDRQGRVRLHTETGVYQSGRLALSHATSQGRFRQTGTNGGSHLGHCHRARELSLGTIGQLNRNHVCLNLYE